MSCAPGQKQKNVPHLLFGVMSFIELPSSYLLLESGDIFVVKFGHKGARATTNSTHFYLMLNWSDNII